MSKITDYTAATTLAATDILPCVDGIITTPTTKKITLANLKTALGLTGTNSGDQTFPYVKMANIQAKNTDGGTATSGAWRTTVLNTESIDTNNIATLAANQLTLPAGTYDVRAFTTFYAVNSAMSRLYNITDSAVLLPGTSVFAVAASGIEIDSIIVGRITIAGTKTIELQYIVQTTGTTTGLGRSTNLDVELFAQIEFIKMA